MNFVKPGDDDEAGDQGSEDAPDDQTVSLPWESDEDGHTVASATEANASQIKATRESIANLRTLVNEQVEVIDEQRDSINDLYSEIEELTEQVADQRSMIQNQQSEIDALRERLSDLGGVEDTVTSLDIRVNELEGTVPDLEQRVTDNRRHAGQLRAAVFEEAYPCPACKGGQIEPARGIMNPTKLACDTCDFEQSTTIQ